MKRCRRFLRGLPVAALGALLFGVLAAGCNTYHYYDITVTSMSPVTVTELSSMNFCEIVVSGSASDTIPWSGANMMGCPPAGSTIGTFEYATFADSGSITFTFNGYSQQVDPSMLCTTGKTTLPANDTITQTDQITLTSFSDTVCPPNVTTAAP
jgi:hypothetical protein